MNLKISEQAWITQNVPRVITEKQLLFFFAQAYFVSATSYNAKKGLQKTWIWPFNREIFHDADYAPSLSFDFDPDRRRIEAEDSREGWADLETDEGWSNNRHPSIDPDGMERQYGVLARIIQRKLKLKNYGGDPAEIVIGSSQPVFSKEEEEELDEYLLAASDM